MKRDFLASRLGFLRQAKRIAVAVAAVAAATVVGIAGPQAQPTADLQPGKQMTNNGEERPVIFTRHVLTPGHERGTGVLYAPANQDNPTFRAELSALLDGDPVDYYDARTGTPPVEMMQDYAAVFTWVDYAYDDNVLMGDNLADYVDLGGKAILGQWCIHTNQVNWLLGRIMSVANYCPIAADSYSTAQSCYSGDGEICIHMDVEAGSYCSSYRDHITGPVGNGMLDGHYDDGYWTHGYQAAGPAQMRCFYSAGNTGNTYSSGPGWAQAVANMVLLCTGEPMYGACCNEATGDCFWAELMECNDLPGYDRWEYEVACNDLDPPCGAITQDCNDNGIPDLCDISCDFGDCATIPGCGQSDDCQPDGIPDDCQVPPECSEGQTSGDCCYEHCSQGPGCEDPVCEASVCSYDSFCCIYCWDGICALEAQSDVNCYCDKSGTRDVIYQHDDGVSENSIGLTAGGYVAWMNHFATVEDGGTITEIHVSYSMVSAGTPTTVILWSDPNQDADPTDAQVHVSVDVQVVNPDSDYFVAVDIPDTYVGEPGTHFFVGALIYRPSGQYPCAIDQTASQVQSWICGDGSVPIAPNNLGAAALPPGIIDGFGFPGNWLIRAVGRVTTVMDCNGNCIPDDCDIMYCYLEPPDEQWWCLDCNNNGCPDEGDLPDNDCDENLVPDDCQIAECPPDDYFCQDCDEDGILDGCQLEGNDCNDTLIPDNCELEDNDCNENGIPDECELPPICPECPDCEPDGIPDDCAVDCNENGNPDFCDIRDCDTSTPFEEHFWCLDCQPDEIPDGCQIGWDCGQGTSDDAGGDAVRDDGSILYMPSQPDDAAWRAEVAAITEGVVDYFDPRYTLPTPELLAGYDLVYTWVNYAYADNVAQRSIEVGTPSEGLVAHWAFDEGTGSTAHDSSGHGNHGTISGAEWVDGACGSALDIVGTDIVRYIPSSFDDSFTTSFTVVAWVHWHGDAGNYGILFDARSLYPSGGFTVLVNRDGIFRVQVLASGGSDMYVSNSSVALDQWTHVAAVFDHSAGTVRLFKNGVEDSTHTVASPYSNSYLSAAIGNNRWAPGDHQWRPVNAAVDELRIYDRALSVGEVLALYEQYDGGEDCNLNCIPDECDIAYCDGSYWCSDCNENDIPDECDIADGTSQDDNGNGIPDECEPSLDIKPGSCPNPLNRGSHGVLPAALLGTAYFDATTIDVSTVLMSRADGIGGSVAPHEGPPGPHSVFEDVGTPFDGEWCDCHDLEGDGIIDLMMHFKTEDVVANLLLDDLDAGALVELVVTGELLDGTVFAASDCIRLVPPGTAPGLLTVQSSVPGVWVDADPPDETLDGGGFTDFERVYPLTTVVTLTAEISLHGQSFVAWQIDGEMQEPGENTVQFVMDGSVTAKALYRAPVFWLPWQMETETPLPDTEAP